MQICCIQKWHLSCYQPKGGNPTAELSKLILDISSFTFVKCVSLIFFFIIVCLLVYFFYWIHLEKNLTYSWSLLSNLRKTAVRFMTNINNRTKVMRTCGVSWIRSRKFSNMALKSIEAGGMKSVFDANVPKNVLLNFIWFPSALSIL